VPILVVAAELLDISLDYSRNCQFPDWARSRKKSGRLPPSTEKLRPWAVAAVGRPVLETICAWVGAAKVT